MIQRPHQTQALFPQRLASFSSTHTGVVPSDAKNDRIAMSVLASETKLQKTAR